MCRFVRHHSWWQFYTMCKYSKTLVLSTHFAYGIIWGTMNLFFNLFYNSQNDCQNWWKGNQVNLFAFLLRANLGTKINSWWFFIDPKISELNQSQKWCHNYHIHFWNQVTRVHTEITNLYQLPFWKKNNQ